MPTAIVARTPSRIRAGLYLRERARAVILAGAEIELGSISQHSHVMRIAYVISLSVILGSVLGCDRSEQRTWSSKDSWFHPPDEPSRFQEAKRLPDADIAEVAPDRIAAAEGQLRDVACVEISAHRATELTGRSTSPPAGRILFLVRGVYLNRGTGKFMVFQVGSALLVAHGSLGHSAVPMQRQPLVVTLSRKPDIVYVSCSMDE